MGRRTDTRERIIRSSLDEMRRKGYASTAISDIVRASGAPRGSVTFHFPGGKDEIAREVVDLRREQLLAGVEKAAAASANAGEFLMTSLDRVAADFATSGFVAGCPVAPISIDRTPESVELAEAAAGFFSAWRSALEGHLVAFGTDQSQAHGIATVAVCAVEGALVLGRVHHDTAALATVRDQLVATVAR